MALLVVLPLRINVGVRHVLHLYPLLAVYAALDQVMGQAPLRKGNAL